MATIPGVTLLVSMLPSLAHDFVSIPTIEESLNPPAGASLDNAYYPPPPHFTIPRKLEECRWYMIGIRNCGWSWGESYIPEAAEIIQNEISRLEVLRTLGVDFKERAKKGINGERIMPGGMTEPGFQGNQASATLDINAGSQDIPFSTGNFWSSTPAPVDITSQSINFPDLSPRSNEVPSELPSSRQYYLSHFEFLQPPVPGPEFIPMTGGQNSELMASLDLLNSLSLPGETAGSASSFANIPNFGIPTGLKDSMGGSPAGSGGQGLANSEGSTSARQPQAPLFDETFQAWLLQQLEYSQNPSVSNRADLATPSSNGFST